VKILGKNEFFVHETVKKEKQVHASFAVEPHSAKVKDMVNDKHLFKMEKSLNHSVQ
jgi:hypothetical protein